MVYVHVRRSSSQAAVSMQADFSKKAMSTLLGLSQHFWASWRITCRASSHYTWPQGTYSFAPVLGATTWPQLLPQALPVLLRELHLELRTQLLPGRCPCSPWLLCTPSSRSHSSRLGISLEVPQRGLGLKAAERWEPVTISGSIGGGSLYLKTKGIP